MKVFGAQIDKKFIIAAMIGALIASITLRVVNRFLDNSLDTVVGPD